ncbi:homoserine dehydrogenase [Kaistia dalseonensis]|uniref:Homoserine dehydrogenase n=2 Tax=Kaistia dalseonensis TaxID=410840 RepID=A0ABU0H9K0_9HYPH|nr:homoserine dehydrogenase [Kaistia dalseonensis]
MMNQNLGFDEALERAQAGGFAEADTRNDTEGWDTASKLLILANFGLDAGLTMDDLAVEGIQAVSEHDIETWQKHRLMPKLVGSLIRSDGTTRASVGVRTYPPTDPLAHVSGKNKAIRITTDAMGETIAMGSGTEPLATAAAALKDLEHILLTRAARATGGSRGEE